MQQSARLSIVRVCGLGTVLGIVTGGVLGLFLKFIEARTGKKVYTLLLNIDFVPAVPHPLPEWLEFALHMLVAIALGIAYVWGVSRFAFVRARMFVVGVFVGIMTIPAFFPLTVLSARTPAVDDWVAFGWWAVGHVLYGTVLGYLGRFVR